MNKIGYKVKVRGRYKIEAVRLDGTRRLVADWFDNLVTDNGLDLMGSSATWQQGCFVGSGNTAPAFTDTSLVALVGSTNNIISTNQAAQGSAPYFGTTTRVYRFAAGVATGNLSEVGVGASSTSLFSRALILDGSGNPTTITILSSEALDVTYQLQQYVPASDVTGTITINAIAYAYTVRAALATAPGAWANTGIAAGANQASTVYDSTSTLGAVTGSPSGTFQFSAAPSNGAYTPGNKYLDITYPFGLIDGNVSGGVGGMQITTGSNGSMGAFQMHFSPPLPKDSSHTMTLVIRQSWDRH